MAGDSPAKCGMRMAMSIDQGRRTHILEKVWSENVVWMGGGPCMCILNCSLTIIILHISRRWVSICLLTAILIIHVSREWVLHPISIYYTDSYPHNTQFLAGGSRHLIFLSTLTTILILFHTIYREWVSFLSLLKLTFSFHTFPSPWVSEPVYSDSHLIWTLLSQ